MVRRLRGGELVVAFREARRREQGMHADPTTRTSLLRSNDRGSSWHSLVTPDSSGGNGVALAQLTDETLVVANFHWVFAPASGGEALQHMGGYRTIDSLGLVAACEGVYLTRSRTQGFTWECPRRLDVGDAGFATCAGRVEELQDGTLILPINTPAGTSVFASADRGETWHQRSVVARAPRPKSLQEMRVISTAEALLALMRTPEGDFVAAISPDSGHTWGEAFETGVWCGGSSPGDLLLLDDGRVLLTYGHRRPPYGVRACLSEDGGRTWNTGSEIVLRDDGPDRDMGYPSSEQLEDGSILTVYYWHDDAVRHLVSTRWELP